MAVILLTTDLMTSSRVEGAAARTGIELLTAGSAENALDRVEPTGSNLVLVDLATIGGDPREIVERLRGTGEGAAVVAFGPHVHKERLDAARAAGCDRVLTRGQFFAEVDAVLEDAAKGAR